MSCPDQPSRPPGRARRQGGVVLVLVLVFVLLLASSIAVFLRRAVLDATIVSNRDAAARAEALARGGVRLATAMLIEDRLRERTSGLRIETRRDVWAQLADADLGLPDDSRLTIHVDDAGRRLNLNALFKDGKPRSDETEPMLAELLRRAIDESSPSPELRSADTVELADNLIDYVDADDAGVRGGFEDDWYQRQDPPYRAANRPLLSVDELGLVRGFTPELVEALRPYVTVYPYVKGDGINPNTAPAWILAVMYHGVGGDVRFAGERVVGDVLRVRDQGGLWCADEADNAACTPIRESVAGEIFPPPTWVAEVFSIRAEAEVDGIRRSVEAVVDRSDVTKPLLLSWRVW